MKRRARATIPSSPGIRHDEGDWGEMDHYMKCRTCGHMIDLRDLNEVLEHEGPHEPPVKS